MISKGNILILTQWSFKDALIQTYTLPYLEIIRAITEKERKIFLITSEQENTALNKEEIESINEAWKNKNMKLLVFPYYRFGIKKILFLIGHYFNSMFHIKKENIKIIHAFGTPAGSIGYLLSKITGTKLIIDSYEPHAESMVETGTWKRKSFAFKILFHFEKLLTKHADILIATTAGMKSYALEKYGVSTQNLFVKPACVNFRQFYPRDKNSEFEKEFGLKDKVVCVYAGKLGGTYLNDEVFDFVKACYYFWGDKFRFLMLSNESDEQISKQIKRIQIPSETVIIKFVLHTEIDRYLSVADFAINFQVPVPSKKFGTPIKNGEYWAMGLPIVISPDISEDSDIIKENGIGVVINLQQIVNHEKAIKSIHDLLEKYTREELQIKIFKIAKTYRSFEIAQRVYSLVYAGK